MTTETNVHYVSSTADHVTMSTSGWLSFECVPKGTTKRLQRERDEARAQLLARDHEMATLRSRARALEDEVAKLRPAIAALDAERERYQALLRRMG